MTDKPQSLPLSEQVSCAVCLKEVPKSAAVNFEASDYVAHFCGLECYARWKDDGDAEASAVDEGKQV